MITAIVRFKLPANVSLADAKALEARLTGQSQPDAPAKQEAPAQQPGKPAKPAAAAGAGGAKLDYRQEDVLKGAKFNLNQVDGYANALDQLVEQANTTADKNALDHRKINSGVSTIAEAQRKLGFANDALAKLPADGRGVAEAAEQYNSLVARINAADAALGPVHAQLQKLIDVNSYPDFAADRERLAGLAQMFNGDLIQSNRPAAVEIVNTADAARGERNRIMEKYADFLKQVKQVVERVGYCVVVASEGIQTADGRFVADSGGGGQITLGGRSPLASPFVAEPRLLSRLVRFLNRHPSLSYLYSHDFVGSSGQSARADERGTSAVDELVLALDLLDREPDPTPELQWKTLAPFLCDASGNNHRAEINIEKLWNPFLPGRGQMGLVEFRALRMQHTPERATALACLLRAVAAMLATAPYELPLIDWGRELHQRFALPFYLEQDLQSVLDALAKAGLGLGPAIEAVLRREEFRRWADVSVPGCTLEVRRALEFWPLLGDAASPEQGGTSRLVDASTKRIELRLRPCGDEATGDWREWEASVHGVVLPWRSEHDARGELRVYALRYRSFAPFAGLHPSLGAQVPISIALRHPATGLARTITLHEWKPDNGPYPGLPEDLADAAARRCERIEVHEGLLDAPAADPDDESRQRQIARGLGEYCFDLRYLG